MNIFFPNGSPVWSTLSLSPGTKTLQWLGPEQNVNHGVQTYTTDSGRGAQIVGHPPRLELAFLKDGHLALYMGGVGLCQRDIHLERNLEQRVGTIP